MFRNKFGIFNQLCKLPDACGIDIFHGDFGLVGSDSCGDG